jgi:hypothetical protein
MLASISPFGERARGQRWGVTVGAYVVASTVGGAFVAGVLGAIGRVVLAPLHAGRDHTTVALGVIAAVAVAGLLVDAGFGGAKLPGPARQVDENWLSSYRGWVYGAGYGLQLGAAFTTIVSASITYVAFACALLANSIVAAALIGAVFGFARATPQLLTAHVDDPASLRAVMQRFDAALPRARAGAYALQAAAAAAAIAAALNVGGA